MWKRTKCWLAWGRIEQIMNSVIDMLSVKCLKICRVKQILVYVSSEDRNRY